MLFVLRFLFMAPLAAYMLLYVPDFGPRPQLFRSGCCRFIGRLGFCLLSISKVHTSRAARVRSGDRAAPGRGPPGLLIMLNKQPADGSIHGWMDGPEGDSVDYMDSLRML